MLHHLFNCLCSFYVIFTCLVYVLFLLDLYIILRYNPLNLLPDIPALLIRLLDHPVDLPAHLIHIYLTHLCHEDSLVLRLHQIIFIDQQLFIQLLSRP